MSKSLQEIELKLEVAPEAQELLKKAALPNGFASSRATTKTLQSIYFDTPEQSLRKAKISLRIRKVGRSWIQTAKVGTGVQGGLSTAIEDEHRVAGRAIDLGVIEDPQVLSTLVQTIDGQTLEEACETVMRRTARTITAADGSQIEVAFDTGDVKAAGQAQALTEVEFELKSGSAGTLFYAAKSFVGAAPFRFSPCNKSERAFKLADGEDVSASKPALAVAVDLLGTETVEHAFRNVLRSCLEQIAHNRFVVLHSDHPEGPHQLRIGLRRLRSAFRLFKPALNPHTLTSLDDTARAIAARVGDLRDLDALAQDIVAPLESCMPDAISIAPLQDHLNKMKTEVRRNVLSYLASQDVNDFILDLAAYTEARGWLQPERIDQTAQLAGAIRSLSDDSLQKQWKKVARYGRRIDELTIPERHEMRKALKKMRYGVEFFASLYPKSDVKPFLKRMKKLQNIFGYLNDVAMAERLLELPVPKGAAAHAISQTIGFTVGWHESQSRAMWGHAKEYWLDTKAAPKFWS